jgi:hypothetical protein
LLLWLAAVAAVAGAGLVGVLFATRWITALGLSGLLLLDAGAWLLTRLSAPTGDGGVMLVAFVLGLGAGVSVAPGMFLASLSVPPVLTGRTLALITLLRYAVQVGVGPPVTHLIATRTSIHYADLATEAGANGSGLDLLVGALTRRYMAQGLAATQAHVQAVQTIIQELTRQGQVLAINDVAALLLLAIVLGAAVAGLILLGPARRPAPAAAAVPGGLAQMAARA